MDRHRRRQDRRNGASRTPPRQQVDEKGEIELQGSEQQQPHPTGPPPSSSSPPAPPSRPKKKQPPAWTILSPTEWAFCSRSSKPKPPRSHYDHVTSSLVLNMDHFCPWMANVVGYFNYRYFLNFLIYVFVAMVYSVCLTYDLFRQASYRRRRGRGGLRGTKGVSHDTFHPSMMFASILVNRLIPRCPLTSLVAWPCRRG